jgi:hypothetical protein
MGVNPSKQKNPQAPVSGVQWVDAARFCNKASELEGSSPATIRRPGLRRHGRRLPAADGSGVGVCLPGRFHRPFPFGNDLSQLGRFAWTRSNSEGKIRPVGQKEPNAWGLYDMLGNVWQWTNDWFDEEQKQRTLRGGAWDTDAAKVEVSMRKKEFPVYTDACFGADSNGFRRVKNSVLPTGGAPIAVVPAPVEVKKDPPPAPPPRGGGRRFRVSRGRSCSSATAAARWRSGGCTQAAATRSSSPRTTARTPIRSSRPTGSRSSTRR